MLNKNSGDGGKFFFFMFFFIKTRTPESRLVTLFGSYSYEITGTILSSCGLNEARCLCRKSVWGRCWSSVGDAITPPIRSRLGAESDPGTKEPSFERFATRALRRLVNVEALTPLELQNLYLY